MRNAINNNPKVQIAVIGVLILLVAVVVLPSMMGSKGSSSSGTTTNTVSAQATSPSGSVDLTVKTTQPVPGAASAATGAGVAPPVQTVEPQALVPGPGLPRPLIDAWKSGKAVVLLIVRSHAVDDQLVTRSVRALSSNPGLAVFVVRADNVARYSRVTQGVGVSQVPALVVIRPKRVTGSVPEAQVTYGFRDSQAVVQYVHDALYSGKDDLPYSPR